LAVEGRTFPKPDTLHRFFAPRRPTIRIRPSIRDLHDRLKQSGFSWSFVRSYVLPEWWQDKMADDETDRALAEAYIAKQLGFSAKSLRKSGSRLDTPPISEVRFKRYKNQIDDQVKASAIVALRAAHIVVQALDSGVPEFRDPEKALEVRDSILRHSEYVDLDSLLDFCWTAGIVVLHLAKMPGGSKSKRFDGLAAVVSERPVIALASVRDRPPWLAFYLAHELGHIMHRHVRSDKGALVDRSLTGSAPDSQELEADRFACELLWGHAEPNIPNLKVNAPRLAVIAATKAPKIGVDPGVYALIYAKCNNRWPVAQDALKHLRLDSGGRAKIAARLESYVSSDQLSETDEQFLRVLQGP